MCIPISMDVQCGPGTILVIKENLKLLINRFLEVFLKEGTTNQMVDPYGVIVRKLFVAFSQRVNFSDNILLQNTLTAIFCYL